MAQHFLARDRHFYQNLFRLILIVSLQNILAYSVNVADNIMLGGYSQAALSGAATVNQIQFLVQQITIAIGDAMGMLITQYWGKGDTAPIRSITGIALKAGLCFGGLVLLLTALLPHQLLRLFTSDETIVQAGVQYLQILKFSYLFYIVTTLLMAFLRSMEVVTISFYVSLMSLLLNVAINYTLIFGHFGFPELGLQGAAIGTLTARIMELLVVLSYVLFREKRIRLFSKNPFHRNAALSRDYRNVAVPVVLTNLLWSLATPIQTGILGHLSSDAIAANSVSTTMFQYLKVVTVSEASATSVSVGGRTTALCACAPADFPAAGAGTGRHPAGHPSATAAPLCSVSHRKGAGQSAVAANGTDLRGHGLSNACLGRNHPRRRRDKIQYAPESDLNMGHCYAAELCRRILVETSRFLGGILSQQRSAIQMHPHFVLYQQLSLDPCSYTGILVDRYAYRFSPSRRKRLGLNCKFTAARLTFPMCQLIISSNLNISFLIIREVTI